MAFLKLLNLIVVLLFSYDCSKEYNLKEKLCEERERTAVNKADMVTYRRSILLDDDMITYRRSILLETKDEEVQANLLQYSHTAKKPQKKNVVGRSRTFVLLKRLLLTPETLLLLTSSGLFTYILCTLDLLITITVLKVFEWSEERVSITYASYSAAYFVSMVVLSKYCISNKRVYMLSLLCIFCIIVCLSLTACIRSIHLSETNKLILLVTFQLAYLPSWLLEEIVHANLLARIVRADVQCLAEGFRGGVARISAIVASFLIAMEIDIKNWAYVMIALSSVWLCIYLFLHKRMTKLKVML